MSREAAFAFILLFYYRRLFMAIIIVAFNKHVIVQVIGCMLLQLGYIIFLLHFKIYGDLKERRIEILNELVILATSYICMCLAGAFI